MRKLALLSALFICLVTRPALHAQQLTIQTDAGKQVLDSADIGALPHVRVTASEHSSESVSFEGVTLKSILEKVGISFGASMKGKRLSSCLLVEAADGYRVVIALPELDPAFRKTDLISIPAGREAPRRQRRAVPNRDPG